MLANFQKTFKPTEEDKQERTIRFLNLIIKSIEDRNCSTCKNGDLETVYEHGGETVYTHCKINDKICVYCSNCSMYEVDEERFWM